MNYEDAATRLRPAAREALEAYDALAAANHEHVERVRDYVPSPGDFWAGRASRFRPGVLRAEELPALIELARPDDVWLDIGAGGGRFAVPLSHHVARMVAVEPSAGMRDVLAEAARADSRENIEVVDLNWPPAPGGDAPAGDVSLVANVLYDVPSLDAFLTALEAHTRRLCVAILADRAPSTPNLELWEAIYGEPLPRLPALPEFVAVLGALGRRYEVRTYAVHRESEPMPLDDAMHEARLTYWTAEGSEKDRRLREVLVERFSVSSGEVQLPPRRNYTAIVSWPPPGASE